VPVPDPPPVATPGLRPDARAARRERDEWLARLHFDRVPCLSRAWGEELMVSRWIVNDRESFVELRGGP
jgi:hypothetical protein